MYYGYLYYSLQQDWRLVNVAVII